MSLFMSGVLKFRKEESSSAMDSLSLFNQQVLQCQDDAYTLAWYLLGDEAEAEAVMQSAIQETFQCYSSNRKDCRLLILKQVAKHCLTRKPAACSSAEPDITCNIHFLTQQERVALVLIDILQFDYPEASFITGIPLGKIGPLLGHARWKMKDQMKLADP